tara:strand:- start:3390 stop:4298 length:909 start_codon:yes stop_codon:yes gene_type:complete
MTLLFICSTSINDIVSLNVFYNAIIKQTDKDDLKINLITTEKPTSSNIFFSKDVINTHLTFSFSKTFNNALEKINAENYDYVIKIGENLKSELLYKFISSKHKIRTRLKIAKLFRGNKDYGESQIKLKCIELFDQLKNFEIPDSIKPEMILNHSIYAKTFEIVNWFLKSSNQFTLTNYRFCFLYLDINSEKNNNYILDMLDGLLESKTLTIPVFSTLNEPVKKYLDEITKNNPNMLISNFVLNNDQNHISLFLKYSKFVVTNNASLKIACAQIQKKIVYYDFDSKKEFTKKDVFLDINLLNK